MDGGQRPGQARGGQRIRPAQTAVRCILPRPLSAIHPKPLSDDGAGSGHCFGIVKESGQPKARYKWTQDRQADYVMQ